MDNIFYFWILFIKSTIFSILYRLIKSIIFKSNELHPNLIYNIFVITMYIVKSIINYEVILF